MTGGDSFPPTQLFAFPLYSSVIAGFEERRGALTQEILAMRDAHAGVVRSNRNAWHSGEEFLQHRSENVAWVLQKILKFSRFVLGRYYDNWQTSELDLGGCWANVLDAGGWNAPHHHFPCHWSGVFYVSTGPVGEKQGDPAGMIEFLNPTPWLSAAGQPGNFLHAPKNGLMLIFPASIYHFVHPHSNAEPRVSIAYNFNVIRKASARA